ncbi:MAG TPA: hypothetical protein VHN81_02325 [Edaphobacter sp.]|nr:hypothetical protein [Edaphobacter sp.]
MKGKQIVRRVLSVNPPTTEVSFEDSGEVYGVKVTGMGSYTSVIRPDGSLIGNGQGIALTDNGEPITWTGTGLGKFGWGGSVSYRGMLFFQTQSKLLSALNNSCAAFEYEIDPSGNITSTMWEWT